MTNAVPALITWAWLKPFGRDQRCPERLSRVLHRRGPISVVGSWLTNRRMAVLESRLEALKGEICWFGAGQVGNREY